MVRIFTKGKWHTKPARVPHEASISSLTILKGAWLMVSEADVIQARSPTLRFLGVFPNSF